MKTLQVENIIAGYGQVEVLRSVSLYTNEGEIVTILGLNGAGKSTLLRTISGLLHCRAGKITGNNSDITNMAPERIVGLGIVHTPEGRQLFGPLTVHENLLLGSYSIYKKMIQNEREKLFEFVYDLFPVLRNRQRQRGNTLSGGEQQMLAIGRTLMAKPKLIMLDEPSLGLAPLVVESIFNVIKRLNSEGMTFLLVEQDVVLALNIAARGYVMETGRIIIEDDAGRLLENKRVTELLLE